MGVLLPGGAFLPLEIPSFASNHFGSFEHPYSRVFKRHHERADAANTVVRTCKPDARNPQDSVECRIAVLRRRFVESFAGHADFVNEAARTLRSCNINQGGADRAAIAWVAIRASFQVRTHILGGGQVFSDIPSRVGFVDPAPSLWQAERNTRFPD